MGEYFYFTSEQVSNGHPDKFCDFVSDSVLDAYLALDPNTKLACETAAKNNVIMVFGEVHSSATVDLEKVIRNAIKEIGYDNYDIGFDYKTCEIINQLDVQSPEIANAVHVDKDEENIGAGDQGLMIGYATNETEELMPLTFVYASKLLQELYKNKSKYQWLRPDAKSQVTVKYEKLEHGAIRPLFVDTILISVQHSENIKYEDLVNTIKNDIVHTVIDKKYLTEETKYFINPSESFILGGPRADAGLTGRKIIADTYGGWGGHGGGAFSGKDGTKVDRSAAYAARWVAKSVVHSGFASRCMVQLSYGIGLANPISIHVETYGTSTIPNSEIVEIIKKTFDLRPGILIKTLDLKKPIFKNTCTYGHFMPKSVQNVWEKPINLKK